MPKPPLTAYKPGKRLTVGSHEVEIIKFIGEGGFAHVYTVTTSPPIPGQEIACLKRVQVPNKVFLNLLRAEVGAMQQLKGCSNVVQYIDSHAERMHSADAQGQYEVFLLMEFCEGGGLIDFMNTRLRDQLREHEILKIMYDITLGLSHMHYLQPPLLHRDLKIENVLIKKDGTFKLCDFGSVSPVLRGPTTPQEFKILDDDIQHHTTVQYRSPEMLNITANRPIDEKSDIWALGIFLYKLCYYTTPFERQGQTFEQFKSLVLSSSFQIPLRPAYSERLQNMIRVLLQPDPRLRPNVFQVMQEICAMRHVECPIQDIYQRPRPMHTVSLQQPLQLRPLSMPASGYPVSSMQPTQGVTTQGLPTQASLQAQGLPTQGVPHAMPASLTIPNPITGVGTGMMIPNAVPGVRHSTSTSNMSIPVSPVMNPSDVDISPPLSPLPDIEMKYPSLEELDQIGKPLIDLNGKKNTSTSNPTLTPATSTSTSTNATSGNTSMNTSAINIAPHGSRVDVPAASNEFPMPSRPRKPLSQNHSQSQPSIVPKLTTSFSEDVDLKSDELPSSEATKLKKILTGISNRPSTVIMDPPPDVSRNLSSVDFLRTLNTDQGDKKHLSLHKPALHKPRKPSFSRFYKKHSKHQQPAHQSTHQPGSHSGSYSNSQFEFSDSDYESEDFETDDDDSDYSNNTVMHRPSTASADNSFDESPSTRSRSAPVSPEQPPIDYKSKPQFKRLSLGKDSLNLNTPPKPKLKPLGPRAEPKSKESIFNDSRDMRRDSMKTPLGHIQHDPSLIDHSSSVQPQKLLKPKLKPKPSFDKKPSLPPKTYKYLDSDSVSELSVNSTGSFMPTNVIQLKVQQFLNSHDKQHPKKKSAKGYGKFTDVDDEFNEYSDEELSDHLNDQLSEQLSELRRTKSAANPNIKKI